MPSLDYAIEIEGLVKSFGPFRALDNLDLRVRVGEVHGFLGPNGGRASWGPTRTVRKAIAKRSRSWPHWPPTSSC